MKKIIGLIKLQLPAGKASPSPPVGPALGQHGVNIMEFCKSFNAKTQKEAGMILPVVITVYADRSFSYIVKTPPAAILLKKEAGLATEGKPGSGSPEPNRVKVAKVTIEQLKKIAEIKKPDLNANDVDAAVRIIAGTARSMGIDVVN